MKRVCLYCVLLWAAVACAPGDNKYSERDFVGIWVEPVPGMAGVQGIALEEDGAAHSVNMATLRYETWKYEKGRLVLTGMSIGNGVTIPFSDTDPEQCHGPDSPKDHIHQCRIQKRRI